MKPTHVLPLLLWPLVATANFVSFSASPDALAVFNGSWTAQVVVDESDWPGVHRVADDLVADFGRVANAEKVYRANSLGNYSNEYCASDKTTILVGTLGKLALIDLVVSQHLIDVSNVKGKWETYTIARVDGCNTVVVAGSDKRGAIFGAYEISRQIGVSPWYFWADVPVAQKLEVYFNFTDPVVSKEPTVKYRGVFINDEEPALTRWVNKNFSGGNYSSNYVHDFYVHVFEVLLRQKANFLWPAMWNSMFALNDDQNQYWADYYGVVMLTSHTEPMQRATNEWLVDGHGEWDYDTNKDNITEFWRAGVERGKPYEGVWTEGMRGFADTAMTGTRQSELLEDVISVQQGLLRDVFGVNNVSSIPQVWCLYKEVQGYYEKGMSVPEDITLLWTDDNWGNIRRLPKGNETSRSGGAGVYYHFDYVGETRDYKWINTVSLPRTWEQMNVAVQKEATEIWVVNVGDFKALEIPIAYFLDLGYDFDSHTKPTLAQDWSLQFAQDLYGDFANDSQIAEIADLIDQYSYLSLRTKFELLNETVYNSTNYEEATSVLAEWSDLSSRSWAVHDALPLPAQASFFQLVFHPAHAGFLVHDIYISAGFNHLYSTQSRNMVNGYASHVRDQFYADDDWRKSWDALENGRWEHFMDQPHLGYQYWQNPMRNAMPAVAENLPTELAMSGLLGISIDGSRGAVPGDGWYNGNTFSNNTLTFPELNPYSNDTWLEVYSRGTEDFNFTITPQEDFVTVSVSLGSIQANDSAWNSVVVDVSVDWEKAPEGWSLQYINYNSTLSQGPYFATNVLFLPINNTRVPQNASFSGFVESQGHVAMEAGHFTGNTSLNDTHYQTLQRYGRTGTGVTLFPVTAGAQQATNGSSYLEYDFYAFTGLDKSNVTIYFSPSMNIDPQFPLRYAVGIDDEEPVELQVYKDPESFANYADGWEDAVARNVWIRDTTHDVAPGAHTLKLWLLTPNLTAQKIVVDFGGVQESYLGPPESWHGDA